MKVFGLVTILIVGWGSYHILGRLSPDAVAMAIGVLFGILAGIPTMLLMLATNRQPDRPPAPQMPTVARAQRYQVIATNDSPYVLDVETGARYAIVKPTYEIEVKR